MKSDHIKRMITLTGDNIKRLSLYNEFEYKKTKDDYESNWRALGVPNACFLQPEVIFTAFLN